VPSDSIKEFENHLIGSSMLAKSIVHPPEGCDTKKLLTLLDISKISEIKEI